MADDAPPSTKTTIDSLVELLKKKGKMDLASVSVALGVDQSIVENWAKVLEKGNIVKITYEVGKMFLTISTLSAEQEATEHSRAEAEISGLMAQSESQMLSLDKLTETLESIKGSVATAEKAEASEMPEIRRAIADLNSIYATVEQRNRGFEQMAKKAEQIYDEINKRVIELSTRLGGISGEGGAKGVDDARQELESISKSIASINSQISAVGKSSSESMDQIRRSVIEQSKALERQIEQSKKEIDAKLNEYAKQADTVERQLKDRVRAISSSVEELNSFSKEREKQLRRLRDSRVELNNYYMKMSEELNTQKSSAAAISKEISEKVARLKSGFGEAAEIDDTLSTLKSQMAGLEREIADARQDVNDITNKLRALSALSSATTEQKTAAFSDLQKRASAARSRVSNIEDKVGNAESAAGKIAGKKKK
ncbi:MAG: hypothetical protein M1160_03650 [Candidatus Marsarchaeota archaeon]|jgi:chromosome segregation ATPase|nr:hypothetical protein [Candidatus Marsarchaeota archaeon]MCL5111939.1 hypothetical protein [Candidatus Marsarchaeota archaeon]